jgi:hypothetical protein
MKRPIKKLKLPYALNTVLRKQDEVLNTVFLRGYSGKPLNGTDVVKLSGYLREWVRRPEITLDYYLHSLDPLQYREPSDTILLYVVRRIIATALTAEFVDLPLPPVTPHVKLTRNKWAPLKINHITQINEAELCKLNCTVLSTELIDTTFELTATPRKLRFIAFQAGFQFTRRNNCSFYHHRNQLTDLHLIVELKEGTTTDHIAHNDIGYHDPTVQHNHKIMQLRAPAQRDCPYKYNVPCYRCGRGKNHCPIATIPLTTDIEPLIIEK